MSCQDRRGVFWMVWVEGERSPTMRHDDEERAVTEAERLARKLKPAAVFVLRAVKRIRVTDIEVVDLQDDEIPF